MMGSWSIPGQRRLLPLQAHSSAAGLRLHMYQGHAEIACLKQTCCCSGDSGEGLSPQRGDYWSGSAHASLWTLVPRVLH